MKAELAGPPLVLGCAVSARSRSAAFAEQVCADHRDRARHWSSTTRCAAARRCRWTYDDLLREARAVARSLLAAGVRPGDRVAILMANRPEAVAAFFGAAMAGAVVAPLSTFSTGPELAQLLALARPRRAAGADAYGHAAISPADLATSSTPRAAGSCWSAATGTPSSARATGVADRRWIDARGRPSLRIPTGCSSSAPARPRQPKGVLHAQRAPTLQFWIQARALRTDAGHPDVDGAADVLDRRHEYGDGGDARCRRLLGHAGGLRPRRRRCALMARERVTEPYTLPHQARALEEHPDWASADLSSLRQVYGKSVFTRHPTVHGDPSWQMPVGWGMSETCAFVSAHPSDAGRETSCGAAWAGSFPAPSCRVIDPDSGEVVELGMRRRAAGARADADEALPRQGAGRVLRRRAAGFTPATSAISTSAASCTGPGRRTEMIKTGGANVSPAEIEVQMRACSGCPAGARPRHPRRAARPDRRAVRRADRRRRGECRFAAGVPARAAGRLQGAQAGADLCGGRDSADGERAPRCATTSCASS